MYQGQCLQIPSLVRDYSRSFLKTKAVKTNICRYRKEKNSDFPHFVYSQSKITTLTDNSEKKEKRQKTAEKTRHFSCSCSRDEEGVFHASFTYLITLFSLLSLDDVKT